MTISALSYRNKLAIVMFAIAACLVFVSGIPPVTYLQWLIFGVAVGLMFMLLLTVLRWWLIGTGPANPEDVRRNVSARSKWMRFTYPFGVGLAVIFSLLPRYFLADRGEAFGLGVALGVIIFMALLIGPAFWQSAKPKPPERKIPLEPEDSRNQIHVTRSPPRV